MTLMRTLGGTLSKRIFNVPERSVPARSVFAGVPASVPHNLKLIVPIWRIRAQVHGLSLEQLGLPTMLPVFEPFGIQADPGYQSLVMALPLLDALVVQRGDRPADPVVA